MFPFFVVVPMSLFELLAVSGTEVLAFHGERSFSAVLEGNVKWGLDKMGDEFLGFVGLGLSEFDFERGAVFELYLDSVIDFILDWAVNFADESNGYIKQSFIFLGYEKDNSEVGYFEPACEF